MHSSSRCQRRLDPKVDGLHRATILLPNWVAQHDSERNVMDGPAKKFKENNTDQNGPSPAGTAANALRNRCSTAELTRLINDLAFSGHRVGTTLRSLLIHAYVKAVKFLAHARG